MKSLILLLGNKTSRIGNISIPLIIMLVNLGNCILYTSQPPCTNRCTGIPRTPEVIPPTTMPATPRSKPLPSDLERQAIKVVKNIRQKKLPHHFLTMFYLFLIFSKIIRPTIADIAPMIISTIYFIIILSRLPLLNTNFRLQRYHQYRLKLRQLHNKERNIP